MMTGRLGAVDFRAPVDDRWFEDHLPGPRNTTESRLPGRSAAFTVHSFQASTRTWASRSIEIPRR